MTIRVVTYNTHFGANTAAISRLFRQNKNLAAADVIFFQEIEDHPHELKSRAEKIAQDLNMNCFYAPARPKKLGTHGVATLSKFPLEQNLVIELPYFKLILNPRRRVAVVSQILAGNKKITLCNVHLDARLNASQRIKQMDFAVQMLKQNSFENVILGGDFNTHPLLLAGNMVPVFYQNQYKWLHLYLLASDFRYFSKPTTRTMRRWPVFLDHIYTNTLPIINSGVEIKTRASDHNPVWADVNIA